MTDVVDIQDFVEQLHADEEEIPYLKGLLVSANAYVEEFINAEYSDLTNRQQTIFKQVVMEVATNYYLNRDGSAKGVSQSYSGLNYLIDSIRQPTMFFI